MKSFNQGAPLVELSINLGSLFWGLQINKMVKFTEFSCSTTDVLLHPRFESLRCLKRNSSLFLWWRQNPSTTVKARLFDWKIPWVEMKVWRSTLVYNSRDAKVPIGAKGLRCQQTLVWSKLNETSIGLVMSWNEPLWGSWAWTWIKRCN